MHTFSETGAGVPAFLAKLWRLVEDPETNDLISWSTVRKSDVVERARREFGRRRQQIKMADVCFCVENVRPVGGDFFRENLCKMVPKMLGKWFSRLRKRNFPGFWLVWVVFRVLFPVVTTSRWHQWRRLFCLLCCVCGCFRKDVTVVLLLIY